MKYIYANLKKNNKIFIINYFIIHLLTKTIFFFIIILNMIMGHM